MLCGLMRWAIHRRAQQRRQSFKSVIGSRGYCASSKHPGAQLFMQKRLGCLLVLVRRRAVNVCCMQQQMLHGREAAPVACFC
jgi:hypothetical protein